MKFIPDAQRFVPGSTLLALGLFALAPAALAQTKSSTPQAVQDVPQVEVVGVTPVPGLGLPKDQLPSNVQTARAADLERSHVLDLSEFMRRRLGGVHVNEIQNNPLQPDLNYRGFTASPLLGTQQGLSVYVDGMRLNQAFGDVVSWDLLPKSAIASIVLMPGSNPLFGLNTLGGALAIQTKDGLRDAGTSVQLTLGQHRRAALEFETGGRRAAGLDWFVTGNRFHDQGWRMDSPSDVSQLFAKFGRQTPRGRVALSVAAAENELSGNGLQEQRLLATDRASVYTKPDITRNRGLSLNLTLSQGLGDAWSFSGNAYWRRIRTKTFNGDLNDDALDQAVYQPNAAERAALAAAGYVGFPSAGESAANTPFPKWRCIANALRQDEPAEKCNGLINRTRTAQTNHGFSGQFELQPPTGPLANRLVLGAAFDESRVRFGKSAELGYLNADRSITGVGAFADGQTGGDIDGEPYDTRVELGARTRTWSLFASHHLALGERTHLTASARYNHVSVHSRDAIRPAGVAGSLDADHAFSRLNPAVGLSFAAGGGVTGYAGVNQGSRAPSAIELGCADPQRPCKLPNAMAGDPPLRQVVTTTVEAGLRGQRGAMSWNLGLFRADNRDDILFVADNLAGFGYFKNFGRTRRQGLESHVGMRLGPVGIGIDYTFLDASFRSAEVLNGSSNSSNEAAAAGFPGVDGTISARPGHRMPLQPRHILKLALDAPLTPDWSLSADLSGISGAFARGNENNAHQPDGTVYLGPGRSAGYALLNLGVDWRPAAGLKVFAQVNNLLDRRYSSAAQLGATGLDAQGNFVARPFPANAQGERPLVHSTFLAPGAPRNVVVGLRYTFVD